MEPGPTTPAPSPGRRRAGLVMAPLAFVSLHVAPLGLAPEAQAMAALFSAVVIAWVTEVIPIAATALLVGPGLVASGICDARTAFASYADPLLFLFVGGFFIARAMMRHGLDRRLALAFAGAGWVRGQPRAIRFAFLLAGVVLSMWVSNTATTAILAPILLGTFAGPSTDEERQGGLLTLAYGCSVGGLGTLVGSPPNLITARFLGEARGTDFGFIEWMKVGLPAALLMALLVYFVSLRLLPPGEGARDVERETRPWSRGERVTALAFALAVVGWMAPGLLKSAGFEAGRALSAALPGGAVALLASLPLFLFDDDDRRPVLPWDDAARIDWGIIMLFGGGIALGTQMFATGLAAVLAQGFVAATGVEGMWTLTVLVTVFTIFFTEVCSNTASANMLVPLVLAICVELDVDPTAPALGVGLAASCAFMLPIATGPNAIVFGTGLVPLPTMMRKGAVLNLLGALLIVALLRVVVPLAY
ncbi:MAG: DASS family sodium-coupled anion symporter [Myxococcota bacterium]